MRNQTHDCHRDSQGSNKRSSLVIATPPPPPTRKTIKPRKTFWAVGIITTGMIGLIQSQVSAITPPSSSPPILLVEEEEGDADEIMESVSSVSPSPSSRSQSYQRRPSILSLHRLRQQLALARRRQQQQQQQQQQRDNTRHKSTWSWGSSRSSSTPTSSDNNNHNKNQNDDGSTTTATPLRTTMTRPSRSTILEEWNGGIVWHDLQVLVPAPSSWKGRQGITRPEEEEEEEGIENLSMKTNRCNDTTNPIHNHTTTTTTTTSTTATNGGSSSTSSSSNTICILQPCSGIVYNGEVCGIVGPSGAGKTTFVSALMRNDPQSSLQSQQQQQQQQRGGQVWRFFFSHHSQPTQLDHASSSLAEELSIPQSRRRRKQTQQQHRDTSHEQNQTFVLTASSSSSSTITRGDIELCPIRPEQVAWLEQHDTFFDMLTVQETLQLAAFLELPTQSHQYRQGLIQSKLDALGLKHVADRRIGTYLRKGAGGGALSGGERRRLSVAIQLITDQSLALFVADEPTTGLDTKLSERVMNLIHDTVQALNIPAFCVLHQPRSSVWHALDRVIIMASGGRVCYAGPRSEVVPYFARLGYPCPDETNPAEFVVDLVSIDTEDTLQAQRDSYRVESLVKAFQTYQQSEWSAVRSSELPTLAIHCPPSLRNADRWSKHISLIPRIRRLGALLRRSWRQNIRNVVTNGARLAMSIGNAWLLAQLFPSVQGDQATAHSMADRAALLTTAAVTVFNMAYMKAADLFEREFFVLRREQAREQYTVLEYLLAKVVAEIPLDILFSVVFAAVLKQCTGINIAWRRLTTSYSMLTAAGVAMGFSLGSLLARDGLAVTAGLPVVVILMAVGVINPSGVDPNQNTTPPLVVNFLKRISPFAYAINAILIGEYTGLEFVRSKGGWWKRVRDLPRMGAMALVQNGDQVLEALGLAKQTYRQNLKALAWFTAGNLLLSWIGLVWQQRLTKRQPNQRRVSGNKKSNSPSSRVHSNVPTIRRVRI